jgi:hypothetical protein
MQRPCLSSLHYIPQLKPRKESEQLIIWPCRGACVHVCDSSLSFSLLVSLSLIHSLTQPLALTLFLSFCLAGKKLCIRNVIERRTCLSAVGVWEVGCVCQLWVDVCVWERVREKEGERDCLFVCCSVNGLSALHTGVPASWLVAPPLLQRPLPRIAFGSTTIMRGRNWVCWLLAWDRQWEQYYSTTTCLTDADQGFLYVPHISRKFVSNAGKKKTQQDLFCIHILTHSFDVHFKVISSILNETLWNIIWIIIYWAFPS